MSFFFFPEAEQQYDEAVKLGIVKMSIIKCLVLGIAGVGKTHLKWLLLSENTDRTEGRVSTGLVDNPIQAFVSSVESCIAGVDEGDKWTVLDEARLWDTLAKAWNIDKPAKAIVAEDISISPQPEHQQKLSPQPAHQEHLELKAPVKTDLGSGISEASIMNASSPVVVPSERKPYSIPGSKKLDHKYINAFLNARGKILNVKLVHFIDSGGQPEFLELLPAFVQNLSAILFAVNLSEPLDYCPMISFYGKSFQPVGEPYESPYSHKQVLEQCLRVAHATSKSSRVFIVGTHRDKETECSEKIGDKSEIITRISRETNSGCLVLKNATDMIWAINGESPDSHDEKVASQLRQAIKTHCPDITHSLPIKWFCLEFKIRDAAVRGVIRYSKCLDEALSLDMDEEGLQAALLHMVRHNLLLWFHEINGLNEIIFSDPQVILKIITDIVQFKYELIGRTGKQIFSCMGVREDWCTKFKDHALISEEFLSHERLRKHFVDDVFTVKHFITLMCHLFIMVPLEGSHDYLMPTLLDPLNIDATNMKYVHEPLRIHFPNQSSPYGMFSRLIAFLLKAEECLLEEVMKKPNCFYKNCVTFRYKKFPATFTIIDSTSYIEVYLNSVRTKDPCKACSRIRKLIHKGIEKCAEVLHYSGWMDVKDGFVCSNDLCRFVAIPYEDQPNMALCYLCNNDMYLSSNHTVWITEEKNVVSGKTYMVIAKL